MQNQEINLLGSRCFYFSFPTHHCREKRLVVNPHERILTGEKKKGMDNSKW